MKQRNDLYCLECGQKLSVTEVIKGFMPLFFCENEKCKRFGLYTAKVTIEPKEGENVKKG